MKNCIKMLLDHRESTFFLSPKDSSSKNEHSFCFHYLMYLRGIVFLSLQIKQSDRIGGSFDTWEQPSLSGGSCSYCIYNSTNWHLFLIVDSCKKMYNFRNFFDLNFAIKKQDALNRITINIG